MVYLHHNVLALSVASILVSYVLARSIKDDIIQKELAEPEVLIDPAVSAGARGLYGSGDPRPSLADLVDFLAWFRPEMRARQQAEDLSSEALKRSSSSSERADRLALPAGFKRKMFWSPLGHLPASARLGRPQAQGSKNQEVGSPVFRYG